MGKKACPSFRSDLRYATSLPWPDEWFDLVISTDVFEHILYRNRNL